VACPFCGYANDEQFRFCQSCGYVRAQVGVSEYPVAQVPIHPQLIAARFVVETTWFFSLYETKKFSRKGVLHVSVVQVPF
jgi:hypothetical protein